MSKKPVRKLCLVRVMSNDFSVRGVLTDPQEGFVLGTTLELPDKGNQRRISCIPASTYIVDPHHVSPKFGEDAMLVENVEGRSQILIHIGNFTSETDGCILVGLGFANHPTNGPMITSSRKAFDNLMAHVTDGRFERKFILDVSPVLLTKGR